MKETGNVPGKGNHACSSPEVLHTCGELQVVQYSVEMVEMGRKRVEMKNQ